MEDLIEELREGVTPLGIHDDNSTELFDVDGANEKMAEAADALATTRAELAAKDAEIAELKGRILNDGIRCDAELAAMRQEIEAQIATAERANWLAQKALGVVEERDATIHQLGENAAKAAGEYAERVAVLAGALLQIAEKNQERQWTAVSGKTEPEWVYFDGQYAKIARAALRATERGEAGR